MADFPIELQIINKPLDSIAALKALPLSVPPYGSVVGGTLVGIRGGSPDGGLFQWDAASTATDDDKVVVLPTGHVGSGRWIRLTFARANILEDVSTIFKGNVTAEQDFFILDDLGVGGSGGGINGQIRVRRGSDDSTRVNIKADNTQSIFYDGLDLQNSKLSGVFDENQIIYTAKNGDNTLNDGKNNTEAFLTYAKALLEVYAQTPSASNQYAIKTFDAGTYDGSCNMINVTYTHIDAQNATIRSNDCSVNSECSIKAHSIERLSGVGNTLVKYGSGHAIIKADKIENSIATGGGIFLNDGSLEVEAGILNVVNATDTLITANPAFSNKKLWVKGKEAKGRIFTTSITDVYYISSDGFNDCELNANANSEIHLFADVWGGKIVAAGALSRIFLHYNKRTSNPLTDVYDPTATIEVVKPQRIWHYTSNQTLKMTQAGDLFTNKGATGNISFTLPIANTYTEGKPFYVRSVEDYRITVNSASSAVRFVEANGDTIGAGAVYTVPQFSSAKFINVGEFGAYGYWMIVIEQGRWSA